ETSAQRRQQARVRTSQGRAGVRLLRHRRHTHPRRPPGPHPRAGDPAGMARRLDLPLAQRPHPGHRRRRRRPASVPVPRPVAGPAGRGEARAGAGDRPPVARRARRRRRRAAHPRSEPGARPGHRDPAAGPRRLPDRQRAVRGGERHVRAGDAAPRARARPRGADLLLLHRQGRHRARGGAHRPAHGDRRATAAGAAGGHGGGAAGLRARRRHLAGRDQYRDQRLPEGDQRCGDHGEGLPHVERHGADGGHARRGAAPEESDGAQEGGAGGLRAGLRAAGQHPGGVQGELRRPAGRRPVRERGDRGRCARPGGGGGRRPGRAAHAGAGRLPDAHGL
ncbi:MAG: DNA topoisomerase IB (poxvirus type), partial [uncultured Blastococcus sp.]